MFSESEQIMGVIVLLLVPLIGYFMFYVFDGYFARVKQYLIDKKENKKQYLAYQKQDRKRYLNLKRANENLHRYRVLLYYYDYQKDKKNIKEMHKYRHKTYT